MTRLFLASQSAIRQLVLRQAGIPFSVIAQDFDETSLAFEQEASVQNVVPLTPGLQKSFCLDRHGAAHRAMTGPDTPISAYVRALAEGKNRAVDRAALPREGAYVVSADTVLFCTQTHRVCGKPRSREHARAMLTQFLTEPTVLVTGMALGYWVKGELVTLRSWSIVTAIEFHVPSAEQDRYLDTTPEAFSACGAMAIEGTGMAYLRSINGSWSAALGIDIASLRDTLVELQTEVAGILSGAGRI